jgi:hypothetical protein
MEQDWLINIFFIVALIFLGIVTIGVGYLTIIDWREKQAIQGQSRKGKG